jgi:hypothetical protein
MRSRPSLRPTLLWRLGLGLGSAAAVSCGGDLTLSPAVFENRTDTLQLWAATGTPIFRPSAYLIATRSAVRLDQLATFDFIYDITPLGEPVLLPMAAVANTGRTTGNPGLLPTTMPYDSITVAEQTGYITTDTVRVRVGDTFYARSQVSPACFLGIPYYAKLQIIAMNEVDRSVWIQVLSNINCGYRSLAPGLPKK